MHGRTDPKSAPRVLRSVPEPPPSNLPRQLTSFVGRRAALVDLADRLATAPLLTLTGTAGVGKTRLALELAASVRANFQDGTWLVEVAALNDPALLGRAVAHSVRVGERPGHEITQTLIDALRPKRVLIVLDNCEHLVDACAQLSKALLQACPEMTILSTSREPLGVPGEVVWPVQSLSHPSATEPASVDRLMQFEAVQLFYDRAGATRTAPLMTAEGAAAVGRICRRLDGIPLAIELAAARASVLTPSQIAERLDDRFKLLKTDRRGVPARHETLRAAIDWSYALLAEPERRLFRRLSVFAGGWTLEATESVCATDGTAQDQVLDLLTRLIAKSLVMAEADAHGGLRYELLESLRQFSLEHLLESESHAAVRQRHAEWYLVFAERIAASIKGTEQRKFLTSLDAEHDNLRAALAWFESRGETDAALRLCVALGQFWQIRGHTNEARNWLERVLARSPNTMSAARAGALLRLAAIASRQNDQADAQRLASEGLALWQQLGDQRGIAGAFNTVGVVAVHRGDTAAARPAYARSLRLFKELQDTAGTATLLMNLGELAHSEGRVDEAADLLEESLGLKRQVGDQQGAAVTLFLVARVVADADHARSSRLCSEALTSFHEIGDDHGIAECLLFLGAQAAGRGAFQRAAWFLGKAEQLREATGEALLAKDHEARERAVQAARVGIGEAAFAAAYALGQGMSEAEAIGHALADEKNAATVPGLTPREYEVATLIGRGRNNREIAETLVIALSTAERHVANILNKLGLRSRTEVALWAAERGLTD